MLYHVTSRGDRRESIVEDGYDRGLAVVRPTSEGAVGAFPLRTVLPIKVT